jgi:Flp pilus assembly pilin Flp
LEDGQSLVEYALILFLMAMAIFAALSQFGVSLLDYFNRIVDALAALTG